MDQRWAAVVEAVAVVGRTRAAVYVIPDSCGTFPVSAPRQRVSRKGDHGRLGFGSSIGISILIRMMSGRVAKCFVAAIAADKRMQAYRLGRSQLIVFDDVDLAFLVEREWEGKVQPVFFIVRAADRKTAHEINQELQASRETPLGAQGAMSALEMVFFLLPAVLRKPLWWYVRRNPYWFKDMAGTVAVTSMGMFTSGGAVEAKCLGGLEVRMALNFAVACGLSDALLENWQNTGQHTIHEAGKVPFEPGEYVIMTGKNDLPGRPLYRSHDDPCDALGRYHGQIELLDDLADLVGQPRRNKPGRDDGHLDPMLNDLTAERSGEPAQGKFLWGCRRRLSATRYNR